MKKIFGLIILLVVIFPCIAFADMVNNIRFSVGFTGKEGASNIDKIYVKYTTYSFGVPTSGEVTLLRSDNFSTLIQTTPIEDLKFNYAIAITRDGTRDITGVVRYKYTITPDYFNDYYDMSLIASFDARGFDGKKYRANSEISKEDLEKAKNADGSSISSVYQQTTTVATTSPSGNSNTTKVVTTSQAEKEKQERKEKNEEQTKKSLNILMYIIIGIAVVIFVLFVVTIVKMKRANDRV
ncbi:MAG: hypothetical protein K5666_03880 [Bacilli bacterium]|nr:hypothetical protein [Bacilli bacterium]